MQNIFILEPDTYILSDLCYIINDDNWSHFVNEIFDNISYQDKDICRNIYSLDDAKYGKVIAADTKYGDGEYSVIENDDEVATLDVDAGMIGIMSKAKADKTNGFFTFSSEKPIKVIIDCAESICIEFNDGQETLEVLIGDSDDDDDEDEEW